MYKLSRWWCQVNAASIKGVTWLYLCKSTILHRKTRGGFFHLNQSGLTYLIVLQFSWRSDIRNYLYFTVCWTDVHRTLISECQVRTYHRMQNGFTSRADTAFTNVIFCTTVPVGFLASYNEAYSPSNCPFYCPTEPVYVSALFRLIWFHYRIYYIKFNLLHPTLIFKDSYETIWLLGSAVQVKNFIRLQWTNLQWDGRALISPLQQSAHCKYFRRHFCEMVGVFHLFLC